jgi:8-oxo-dGTP pyrophosphatase MutT (NUDIX family)
MNDFQNKWVRKLVNHIEMTLGDKDKVETTMIAAAGVIYKYGDNGEMMVLLIQRAADDHWPLHWEFPRGKCDKPIGERVDKCALREIKEECGLNVEIEKFIDKFQYLADGGKRRTICYNFLCKMKDPNQEVKLSKEHENYMWVTNLGQIDLMVMPEQRKTLEVVLNKENPIISTPKNSFTMNNNIEEFLRKVQ